jgi:hypothetical protein
MIKKILQVSMLLFCSNLFGASDKIADQWYSKVRVGIFYHWGLYTGGGSSTTGSKNLPHYKTVAEFEKDIPSPEKFAENLVKLTKDIGAGYLIITTFHSCDKHMVIFPTKNKVFKFKTKKDYFGAILNEAHKNGIKVVAYFPAHADHYKGVDGDYIDGVPESATSPAGNKFWYKVMSALFKEMRDRYGKDSIDGFWMDGYMSWKPVIDSFPNAVRIGNNQVRFHLDPPPNVSTTEFLTGKCSPSYNRPSGLVRAMTEWGDDNLVPRKDFNEDIPTCNGWWYHGGKSDNEYTKDPTYCIKEMLCSLGMRRKWNFALGLGPLVDGTAPPEFKPMLKTMQEFMKWAKPAIYNTVGGEGAPIQQGWLNSGAFGVIMVDKKEKNCYYLCVLEPPTIHTKTDLKIQHDWVHVKSISDLRTGKKVNFDLQGTINLYNIDWSDIKKYGAKIFKIKLEDVR